MQISQVMMSCRKLKPWSQDWLIAAGAYPGFCSIHHYIPMSFEYIPRIHYLNYPDLLLCWPRSSVGRAPIDLIRRSWVQTPLGQNFLWPVRTPKVLQICRCNLQAGVLNWTELNFIDNNIYIITKLLAPATSKMTNRGGGKGYTLTTKEK